MVQLSMRRRRCGADAFEDCGTSARPDCCRLGSLRDCSVLSIVIFSNQPEVAYHRRVLCRPSPRRWWSLVGNCTLLKVGSLSLSIPVHLARRDIRLPQVQVGVSLPLSVAAQRLLPDAWCSWLRVPEGVARAGCGRFSGLGPAPGLPVHSAISDRKTIDKSQSETKPQSAGVAPSP